MRLRALLFYGLLVAFNHSNGLLKTECIACIDFFREETAHCYQKKKTGCEEKKQQMHIHHNWKKRGGCIWVAMFFLLHIRIDRQYQLFSQQTFCAINVSQEFFFPFLSTAAKNIYRWMHLADSHDEQDVSCFLCSAFRGLFRRRGSLPNLVQHSLHWIGSIWICKYLLLPFGDVERQAFWLHWQICKLCWHRQGAVHTWRPLQTKWDKKRLPLVTASF